uniref:Uncharacterized protein LOC114336709 n=1 Tax=Diabrotica virgifera virgifera TaxID=50390 RepID=A0A6P7GD84_DIAVI
MMARRKCHLLVTFVFFQICLCNVVKTQDDDEAITKYKLTFLDEIESNLKQGELKCAALGMQLLSIKSKEKNDAIFKHVSKTDNTSCYFTGARRPAVNKAFEWPDKTNLGFRNFIKDLPNNDGKPIYAMPMIVVVKSNGEDLIWKDVPYNSKCKPICERMSDTEMDPGPQPPPNPDNITFTESLAKGKKSIESICRSSNIIETRGSPLYIKNEKQMNELHEILKFNGLWMPPIMDNRSRWKRVVQSATTAETYPGL